MDRYKRDTLLGLVFFATLGFLLWATVNLTEVSLGRVAPLRVFFPDAGGLRIGDTVLVLGKRIGKVGDVIYRPGRQRDRIEIVLRIQEELPLAVDYKIEIQETTVLGGRQVQIDPGIGDPLRDLGELRGTAAGSPLQAVGGFFQGEGPSGERLNQVLTSLHEFIQHLNDPDTSIGALVRRRDLYDEVLGTVQSLRRIFQAVEDGQGLLGRAVKDTTLRDEAMRLVSNLAAVSDALRGTEGPAGRLINDVEMGRRLDTIVVDIAALVAKVRAGEGALGRILVDEQVERDLTGSLASLNDLLRKANDPEAGALGRIVSDPDVGTDLKVTLANVREITDKVNTGEGLLATMLNDRELGIRLRRIFTQVSRALEDVREAAPIGNFVQVLVGAF